MEPTDGNQQPNTQPESLPDSQGGNSGIFLVVLLILAVIIVVGFLLYGLGFGDTATPNQPANTNPTSTSETETAPITEAETTEQSGVVGFPSGISLPEEARVISNFSTNLDQQRTQRVVIFNTDTTISTLIDQYRSWSQGNDFSTEEATADSERGLFRATRENQRLTITVTNRGDTRRVQINYISS